MKINIKTILWIVVSIVVVLILVQKFLMSQEKNKITQEPLVSPLIFTISLDKDTYDLKEFSKINIKGAIKNISKDNQVVNTRFSYQGSDIKLSVLKENGDELKWLPPAPPRPLTKEDFNIIKPGQQIEINLVVYNTEFYEKFKSGEYKIKAKYENKAGKEFGIDAWIGTLDSNTIGLILK